MMKYIFLLFFFIGHLSVTGQKSKFTTSVNTSKILIGEPFELTLKAFVAGPGGTWPVMDSIPHFEVLSKKAVDSQQNNSTLILNQVITLTSWDSGRWIIPSYSFAGSGKTAPLLVTVGYTPFDTTADYNDIKDIMDAPKEERTQWYWYVVGAVLLLGLFLLLFPGRKTKKIVLPFVPDADVYKTSLARLDALAANPPSDARALYTELGQILRGYLHRRKGLQADAKISAELLAVVGQLGIGQTTYTSLAQTLQLSDLVLFAKWEPVASEKSAAVESVKQSIMEIEKTK